MKVKISVLFAVLLFSSLSSLFGQQDSKPTRLLIMQDVVYPYKVAEYEKAQKEMNDFIVKNYPSCHGDVCNMIIILMIISSTLAIMEKSMK